MSNPIRLVLTACLAGLVLAGCGSAPQPLAPGLRAPGGVAALGTEAKLDEKLFADLEVTRRKATRGDRVELLARKKGIRAVITTEKGALDGVNINRRDLVKDGKVVVSSERSWIKDAEASKDEQSKKAILKALELLAAGLGKAEVEKADAEDVKKVAEALEAFVKAQGGEKKKAEEGLRPETLPPRP